MRPCVCCNQPSTGEAWGIPLCPDCWGAWLTRPELTAIAVDPNLMTDAALPLKEFCGRYADLTRRWALWHKRNLATEVTP